MPQPLIVFGCVVKAKWLVSFILDRKRSIALSVTQSSSPSPPAWYFKTRYTANSCYKYVVSRWSSGNRRRATSAREVIEVAGSNHAIGVILNLAWGPNNFSPSMIWSLRTRSNSRTGLGVEELLPAEPACCFFLLFLLSIIIFIFFLPFFFQSSIIHFKLVILR